MEVILFDESQAFVAEMPRPETRELGLSLGDRACLALAIQRNLPVLTADQIWSNLNLEKINESASRDFLNLYLGRFS
ncbi:MAG: type II toxin-antitoxin system VapC family toxin [Leptolyngbyaceae cyanobacterium CSU_1_3]|nr:type II toxin-antitoxin system VapC family toxin [Leptolyngbyaceae cyanobacterium CSU_1_3]